MRLVCVHKLRQHSKSGTHRVTHTDVFGLGTGNETTTQQQQWHSRSHTQMRLVWVQEMRQQHSDNGTHCHTQRCLVWVQEMRQQHSDNGTHCHTLRLVWVQEMRQHSNSGTHRDEFGLCTQNNNTATLALTVTHRGVWFGYRK